MSLHSEIKEKLDDTWFDVCKTIYQNQVVNHSRHNCIGLEQFMEVLENLCKVNDFGFTMYLLDLAAQYKRGSK